MQANSVWVIYTNKRLDLEEKIKYLKNKTIKYFINELITSLEV